MAEITREERALARRLKGPSQIERVRAARAIIESRGHNAEALALRGFMAIFHPEVSPDTVRDMCLDMERRR